MPIASPTTKYLDVRQPLNADMEPGLKNLVSVLFKLSLTKMVVVLYLTRITNVVRSKRPNAL